MILFGKFIRIQAVYGKLTRRNALRIFVDSCLTIVSRVEWFHLAKIKKKKTKADKCKRANNAQSLKLLLRYTMLAEITVIL